MYLIISGFLFVCLCVMDHIWKEKGAYVQIEGEKHLYIIEKLKSFFVDTCRLQMESESRDFWQGDGLVAWHYNCHFRFLI